jgi:tRNA(adenine34) deaminase
VKIPNKTTFWTADDNRFMGEALRLADEARQSGEVPVGAVVVSGGRIVGRGFNRVETHRDATAHAEILAMAEARTSLRTKFLTGCHLYVTLEPCAMCAGAIIWNRIDRLVIGAMDPKAGACGSVMHIPAHPAMNHHPVIHYGLMEDASETLLKRFFSDLRLQP